jgi:hypothetical protein
LIGRAIYKICREDDNQDPIVMTTDVVVKTSRQVRDYVLCANCEDLFNKGGEKYLTSLVWRRRNGFPLLDRLRLALPILRGQGYQIFSGDQVGIDTDKLAYYAVSVIWRSGIHQWRTLGRQTMSVVLAVEEEEKIRRYLIGETGLPVSVGVVVNVCEDLASQFLVLTPTCLEFSPNCSIYRLLVRGIDFNVLIAGASKSEVCCVRSSAKRIFLMDNSQLTLNSARHFFEESKWAPNVRPQP